MSARLSISEVVATLRGGATEHEVVATAESRPGAGDRVEVTVDVFLRPVDLLHKERHLRADWLPSAQHTHENVPPEEVSDYVREVFAAWVRKVRQAVDAHEATRLGI